MAFGRVTDKEDMTMGFKDKLGDARRAVNELAAAADGLENKHLRDLIHDAAGRLHDAAGHPQVDEVDPKAEPAQTGEANPMYDRSVPSDLFAASASGGPFNEPAPAPAQTGEPNPMSQG